MSSCKLFFQVAQAQIEEAEYMRKRLNDENCVTDSKPSTATPPSADAKAGSKKSAADIAAEVADRLASSTSSQYIMSSVLSTFAAEGGLTKTTTVSNPFSVNNSVSKPEYIPSQPYQTVLMPQATLIPNSQPQYHTIPNPHSQQYLQSSSGVVTSYAYANVNIPPLPTRPPPPPPTPPSYLMSPMIPLGLTHQPMQMTQHPPPAPSFRPMPPLQQQSGMVFYDHTHSQ